jgi:hypothetical protein
MDGIESNETQDRTDEGEQRLHHAAATLTEAGGQVMQAMAEVAGGIAGAVAGAMAAPLTVAAARSTRATESQEQLGEGEAEDDDEDDGRDDVQQQRLQPGNGSQRAGGSEAVG